MSLATALDERAETFVKSKHQLLIDGQWVDAASGRTFETLNPATEEVLAEVAQGEAEDVDRAVRAARKAFDYDSAWRRMNASDRGRLIWRISDLIMENADELAMLESLDNGKPFTVARAADVAAGGRPVSLHGGVADEDLRQHRADLRAAGAGRVPGVHAARAGGRGRPDHPLELPTADGGLEARAGAGLRMHRGAEAGRADAAVGAAARRADAGGRAAGRRGQHHHGVR